MIPCFKFRLQGKVLIAPTPLYTASGTRLDAVRWTMQVYLPPFGDGGKAAEMNVEVEAWGKARAAAEALREGQDACVTGNVVRRRMLTAQGNYALRKDGSPIWLTDFRVQEVFVSPVMRSAPGGNAAPDHFRGTTQKVDAAPLRGAAGGGLKPPAANAGTPAPAAGDGLSDEDIPF